MQVVRPNFEKRGGLVVVIVQNAETHEVLMPAYANEAAWRQTLETGIATFFSTSRNDIWVKGEESGNFMEMRSMRVDCDGDALIYFVKPLGNKLACHTNAESCFYRTILAGGQIMPAPKAGVKEALLVTEVTIHDNFEDMRGTVSH